MNEAMEPKKNPSNLRTMTLEHTGNYTVCLRYGIRKKTRHFGLQMARMKASTTQTPQHARLFDREMNAAVIPFAVCEPFSMFTRKPSSPK